MCTYFQVNNCVSGTYLSEIQIRVMVYTWKDNDVNK